MSSEVTSNVHAAPDALPTLQTTKAPSDMRFGIILFLATLVIGVVVVFSGPLLNTILSVLGKNPRTLQTKAAMKSVEIAIKGYKTEYLRLPFPGATQPLADNAPYSTTTLDGRDLLEALSIRTIKNPRGIRFWDAPPAKHSSGAGYLAGLGLKDPWGTEYQIILDYNNDGRISDPESSGGVITADVLIYSAGPDKDISTWKDNVRSWK
jgi:hypothetical protein